MCSFSRTGMTIVSMCIAVASELLPIASCLLYSIHIINIYVYAIYYQKPINIYGAIYMYIYYE